MKAMVDASACTGCGLCPEICPQVFVLEGDVATVTVETVPTAYEETCREAAESCPVDAISISE